MTQIYITDGLTRMLDACIGAKEFASYIELNHLPKSLFGGDDINCLFFHIKVKLYPEVIVAIEISADKMHNECGSKFHHAYNLDKHTSIVENIRSLNKDHSLQTAISISCKNDKFRKTVLKFINETRRQNKKQLTAPMYIFTHQFIVDCIQHITEGMLLDIPPFKKHKYKMSY
jgi:hypothetical protein